MSGYEAAPDRLAVAALGRSIFELVVAHDAAWGSGNKARAEAAMALGYAFGGLLQHHSDEEAQILTELLLTAAKYRVDRLRAN